MAGASLAEAQLDVDPVLHGLGDIVTSVIDAEDASSAATVANVCTDLSALDGHWVFGIVVVADGSAEAERQLENILGTGLLGTIPLASDWLDVGAIGGDASQDIAAKIKGFLVDKLVPLATLGGVPADHLIAATPQTEPAPALDNAPRAPQTVIEILRSSSIAKGRGPRLIPSAPKRQGKPGKWVWRPRRGRLASTTNGRLKAEPLVQNNVVLCVPQAAWSNPNSTAEDLISAIRRLATEGRRQLEVESMPPPPQGAQDEAVWTHFESSYRQASAQTDREPVLVVLSEQEPYQAATRCSLFDISMTTAVLWVVLPRGEKQVPKNILGCGNTQVVEASAPALVSAVLSAIEGDQPRKS